MKKKVVGFSVDCKTCGKRKAPRGRSLPMMTARDYCTWECPGYKDLPHPGDLFPGETAEDFGYPCSGPVLETNGEALRRLQGEGE